MWLNQQDISKKWKSMFFSFWMLDWTLQLFSHKNGPRPKVSLESWWSFIILFWRCSYWYHVWCDIYSFSYNSSSPLTLKLYKISKLWECKKCQIYPKSVDPITTRVLTVSHTCHLQRSPKRAGPSFTYSLTSQASPLKHFFCICQKLWDCVASFYCLFCFSLFESIYESSIYCCFQTCTYDFLLACKNIARLHFL